jgi:ABC-type nitrate/sulfonate/bicarbonate transport system ATPase subunit
MLKVSNISFQYAPKKEILSNISFNLKEGQHLCVMGESGSGKSTLLKAIYGLLDLKKGSIYWKNQEVLGPAFHLVPGMSFFKYVAQDFDLMPYTSVAENIGKFLSRFYPEEKEQRTKELLEVIEMSSFANEKVKTLSGGQQQRVAIARALGKRT